MSDTTLVLLPGLLNDERLWAHQRQSLADITVVEVPALTHDDTLAGMAKRVLGGVQGTFSLAGLSMGGYVAMEIMRQAPDRVERLALVDTTARPDLPEQTQRRRDAIAVAESGGFERIMPGMLPMLVHPDHMAMERVGGLAKDMALAVGKDAFVRQQSAIMHRPDSRPSLSRVSCPTLVMCGRDDSLTPVDRHEEMADLIPGSKLVVIEQCGHLSAIEQPHAVSAVLRYWLQS